MNQPSASTRLIGKPAVAAVLYVASGLTALGWIRGPVPWWLGIMALCFIGTVHNAVRELRRYKAWAAEWDAMGGYDAPAASRAKPWARRGKLLAQMVAFALLAWAFCNLTPAGQKPPAFYVGMFFVVCGGCLWKLWQLIATRGRERADRPAASKKAVKAKNIDEVVEWALPPASSSPSRAEITHKLPDYAARLVI